MKRILTAALLTIFSFGICVTSFAVNDIRNLNDWYMNNIRVIEKTYKNDEHKKHDKYYDEHEYKKVKEDHKVLPDKDMMPNDKTSKNNSGQN